MGGRIEKCGEEILYYNRRNVSKDLDTVTWQVQQVAYEKQIIDDLEKNWESRKIKW